jgi:hypothetical protein
LLEQEALQARKREKEAAKAGPRQSTKSQDSFQTPMEVSHPPSELSQTMLRAKKSTAQRDLQAAFRTSFHQSQLKAAFRASFVQPDATGYSTGEEDDGRSTSPAPAPEDESDSSQADPDSTSSSSSTSSCSNDQDNAMAGRISRMSLHGDDIGNSIRS